MEGTTITLQATAVVGSTFKGWGGVCSGIGVCTVLLNQSKEVTANFFNPQKIAASIAIFTMLLDE
jgi:hypothetical protein